MIYVGFSTSNHFVSKAIEFFQQDNVSHAFLAFDMFGVRWVIEAGLPGVVLVPMSRWKGKIVDLVPIHCSHTDDEVIRVAMEELGTPYDFGSLFGFIFTMVGKWFKLKVRNPLTSSGAMVCSELVAKVLQRVDYPGASALEPEQTTPSDLQMFLLNK